MEKLNVPRDNRIKAQQRRASKKITQGIESKINLLHKLNVYKRLKEFLFFGLIYMSGFILAFTVDSIAAVIIGIILMGIAFNSLPIFVHKGLHGILAKNEKINHLISFLVGLPILISATAYQTTHNNHHYQLGRKLDYGTYKQHVKKSKWIWLAYVLQLTFGSFIYVIFIPFLGFFGETKKSRIVILIEYLIIISTATLVFSSMALDQILFYWFYPMLVLNILTNIRGLASHALGDVENIYLSSRTVRCSKLVEQVFLHENYHLEHHLFPRIPSYNLPKVHKLIWERLPEAIYAKSYLGFLMQMIKAGLKNNSGPLGVTHPKHK